MTADAGVVDGYFEYDMDQRAFMFCVRWKRDRTRVSPFEHLRSWLSWYAWNNRQTCPQPNRDTDPPKRWVVPKSQLSLRCIESRVYFAQDTLSNEIKIGTSKKVKPRLREVERQANRSVVLLATLSGDREVEGILHQRFARARIRGEWFRPVPELLEYIEGIKA